MNKAALKWKKRALYELKKNPEKETKT